MKKKTILLLLVPAGIILIGILLNLNDPKKRKEYEEPHENAIAANMTLMSLAINEQRIAGKLLPVITDCASSTILLIELKESSLIHLAGMFHLIQVSGDLAGGQYVFQSYFENKKSRFLRDDLDGVVFGCDCNDPYYCQSNLH